MDPAATVTVCVAADGDLLQVTSPELTFSTGELFIGWRTAALDVVPPAISVVHMSAREECHGLKTKVMGSSHNEQKRFAQRRPPIVRQ